MQRLKSLWFWISNIGVSTTDGRLEAGVIRLFNRILLVYFLIRLTAAVFTFTAGGLSLLTCIYTGLALLLFLLFLLNSKGYIDLSKYILVGSMLLVPYLALLDSIQLEVHLIAYYYIQIIQYIIMLLLFDFYRQPRTFLSIALLSLLNLLGSDYLSIYLLDLPLERFNNLLFTTTKTVAVVAWATATTAMYLYRNVIREAHRQLYAQQVALKKQNQQIDALNKNLKELVSEKSLQVKSQDERLRAYAFLNAHRLRAPLSRALSIVELLKLEQLEEKQGIYWLSESLRELDEVIHEINDALHKNAADEDKKKD